MKKLLLVIALAIGGLPVALNAAFADASGKAAQETMIKVKNNTNDAVVYVVADPADIKKDNEAYKGNAKPFQMAALLKAGKEVSKPYNCNTDVLQYSLASDDTEITAKIPCGTTHAIINSDSIIFKFTPKGPVGGPAID